MGAELPYQICEIGSICRMWRNTQNTHLPCQSTPSLRKVTCPITLYTLFCLFQSTPSLWKVTAGEKMVTAKFQISIHTFPAKGDKRLSLITIYLIISIHTFLAEGDQVDLSYNPHAIYFNPHLPCGRWQAISGVNYNMAIFQSTPSLRNVTISIQIDQEGLNISIHTFLAEGDLQRPIQLHVPESFQSTPSLRKVTMQLENYQRSTTNFNPHLPCGRWHCLQR